MNIIIDKVRDNLTIIDKDNLTHAKGNEIININIAKDGANNSFEQIIKAISGLANLTDNEYNVYKYFINLAVAKDFDMVDSTIIEMTKDIRDDIVKKLMISYPTVYRAIIALITKGVLKYLYDSECNIVVGKYRFNDGFNLAKYYNKDIKFITITL